MKRNSSSLGNAPECREKSWQKKLSLRLQSFVPASAARRRRGFSARKGIRTLVVLMTFLLVRVLYRPPKNQSRRVARLIFFVDAGREWPRPPSLAAKRQFTLQGGAPQSAKNMPVACFLARGRVLYRPPFHSCCHLTATVLFLSHPFVSVSGILSVSDLLHFLSVPTCFYLFVSVSIPVVGATVGAGVSPRSIVIYYSFDVM